MKHAIFVVTDNSGNRKYLNAEQSKLTSFAEQATVFMVESAIVRDAILKMIARDYAPADHPVTIEAWEVTKVSIGWAPSGGGFYVRGAPGKLLPQDLSDLVVAPPKGETAAGPYSGYIPRATVLEFD